MREFTVTPVQSTAVMTSPFRSGLLVNWPCNGLIFYHFMMFFHIILHHSTSAVFVTPMLVEFEDMAVVRSGYDPRRSSPKHLLGLWNSEIKDTVDGINPAPVDRW